METQELLLVTRWKVLQCRGECLLGHLAWCEGLRDYSVMLPFIQHLLIFTKNI